MEPFWEPFTLLLLRCEETLSDEERQSLRYLKAFDDDFLGLGGTRPRRWCAMARETRALIRGLGRMPTDGDSDFTPAMKKWLAQLRYEELCEFQRAALEWSEFWEWPVR